MEEIISKATQSNWKRLRTEQDGRLISRANKRMSKKNIIPFEYISDKRNLNKVFDILNELKEMKLEKEDIIYSLALSIIASLKIENQCNVQNFIKEYSKFKKIEELINYDLSFINEKDILGLIYQSLLTEGEKNKKGSYYTPKEITQNMINNLKLSDSQTFLDPCCGSGAFLLDINAKNPEQIYGVDIDEIAVMIAKINLIIKYKGIEFTPNIFCTDFLAENYQFEGKNFSYIITNPPWGGVKEKNYVSSNVNSNEIFSHFIVKSFEIIQHGGMMRFLLPISVLNVKAHKDIRKFMLDNGDLTKITLYDKMFTGVTTECIDVEIKKCKQTESVIIDDGKALYVESKENFKLTANNVFSIIDSKSKEIIKKIQNNGKYYLTDSIWALGIVTGDNKNKLADKPLAGYEAIYTGKEIMPYCLKKPNKYLKYDRNLLQQVAKDEYYRAPEKLVYKFISNKLVFAYDSNRSLFLNSANILIPNIPNMNIKTAMAYLNSELFSYYYKKLFGEIKILKGNLAEIPFPKITESENVTIMRMVDEIINNNMTDEKLQQEIYKTYGLSENDIRFIKEEIKLWNY